MDIFFGEIQMINVVKILNTHAFITMIVLYDYRYFHRIELFFFSFFLLYSRLNFQDFS